MSNPHWPQFPGVPNMVVDQKGRPNVIDLIPGQQEGTPLSQSLINPLINTLCDLTDDIDQIDATLPTLLPTAGGDITGELSIQGKKVALIDDVNAEKERAQKAEAGKLALTGGTVTGVINANYPVTDKPGSAGSAIPNTFWVDQYYADKTALENETVRAQAAEAVKLQTVPASDNDDRLNNLVWNHTGNHLAAQLPDNSWRSFYPTDASVQALVYSDADARPTTIRTLKKGWGNYPELLIENDNSDPISSPSTRAVDAAINTVNNAINNETERAKSAEKKLTKKSDFLNNLETSGYQKLPGGLIIQWVSLQSSSNNYSFPTAFPNKCLSIIPGNNCPQGTEADAAFAIINDNKTFFAGTWAGHYSGYAMSLIAIGY